MRSSRKENAVQGAARRMVPLLTAALIVFAALRTADSGKLGLADENTSYRLLAIENGTAEQAFMAVLSLEDIDSEHIITGSPSEGGEQPDNGENPTPTPEDTAAPPESPDSNTPEPTIIPVPATQTPPPTEFTAPQNTAPGYPSADAVKKAISNVKFKSTVSEQVDWDNILTRKLTLPKVPADPVKEPLVLIIHTHASESYTQEPGYEYEESDPYRTQNQERNIVHIGDVLAEQLESYGIGVVHDATVHDYPSYIGAYTRSYETVRRNLEKYPSIQYVLDVHRDAGELPNGQQMKTIAEINGQKCAQIMFVNGSNISGLDYPNWRDNLRLSIELTAAGNLMYPTLMRTISVKQHRYNQHLRKQMAILEVGSAGNTMAECETAIWYFANVYAGLILSAGT
ncbi:MAG: stage II sporulation protein P [Oscillospiraceae bacterium]|jgi:stage II sporulation protein P|nr:stage II sporulation protein P [Oscillospiraceae bacterium]